MVFYGFMVSAPDYLNLHAEKFNNSADTVSREFESKYETGQVAGEDP